MAEPECCGTAMVHNSWAQQYECADAYFALVDEGFGEGTLESVTADEVGPELAPALEHWRQSRRPDGATCERCPNAVWMVCCSSHGKLLCHRCYRQTHFVEVCVEGCTACQAEGLPVVMS